MLVILRNLSFFIQFSNPFFYIIFENILVYVIDTTYLYDQKLTSI